MLRLGAIFIVLCMGLIAASFGAVLFLMFGVGAVEAGFAALVGLTVLALYNSVVSRLRERSDVGAQIADLSRGTADLARQVAEYGRRISALEGQGQTVDEAARAAAAPLSAELSELGTLVKQLAELVSLLELKLARNDEVPAAVSAVNAALGAVLGEPEGEPAMAGAPAALEKMVEIVRGAIEANRADLYLQPIVTLPQRKVRYYEALTRLRTEDGTVLQPADFLGPAEAGGLMARIDNLMLLRCVQVVRRLQLKNRDIGLFCNIATSTVNDPRLFPQMMQFLEANRALAPSVVLEFRQSAWRAMGPLELESLAAVRELGFRFCMDQVTTLRMEPRDLAERGVRFVKVPAALLLGHAAPGASDIHAADLSDLLGRYGISLIAEKIETESQVVDLLDHEMGFGQGFLFSPPRPVRADALQADPPASEPPEKPRDKPQAAGASLSAPL